MTNRKTKPARKGMFADLADSPSSLSNDPANQRTESPQSEQREGEASPKKLELNGVELKNLSAHVSVGAKRQFDTLAAQQGKPKTDLLVEALNLLFERYNLPPVDR